MQGIKRKVHLFTTLLSIPFVNIGYSYLNNSDRGVNSLVTDFDQAIPFMKVFVLPYVSWYLFIFLTLIYFGLKDWETYRRILIAVNIGLLGSYCIYFIFQTTVPRPELVGMDGLTQVLRFIYNNDQPYNCFPSIHCLTSYLMLRGIQGSSLRNRLNTLLITGMSITIIISTLFIKQHTVLDVVGAVVLANLALRIAKLIEEMGALWVRKALLLKSVSVLESRNMRQVN